MTRTDLAQEYEVLKQPQKAAEFRAAVTNVAGK
jgi:hypothetical protein